MKRSDIPDDPPRWRCSACGDEMHPRFRPSHTKLCPLISALMARDVQEAVDHFESGPNTAS